MKFRRARLRIHEHQRRDDGDVADAVDQEAITFTRFTPDRNDRTRNGWPDETCAVHHRGVQCDGVGKVGSILEHFNDESLTGGNVECIHDALKHGQSQDVPDVHVPAENQASQGKRLEHGQNLRHFQNRSAIPPVHPDSRKWGQQQSGYLSGETDHAEQQCGICQAIDEPARSDLSHPRAD